MRQPKNGLDILPERKTTRCSFTAATATLPTKVASSVSLLNAACRSFLADVVASRARAASRLGNGVRHHSNLSCQVDLSAIIAVTDLISPTPPILTGIGTPAWHRRSIWRYRPTPLKSFLRNTEVSVRLFVVPQNPTLPLPREDIMSSPTIYKDCSGIWTRILRLTEFLKMNARLF